MDIVHEKLKPDKNFERIVNKRLRMMFGLEGYASKEMFIIPLTEICPRFVHKKYVKEEIQGLIQSIRKLNVLQPILIMNIESYIKQPCLSDDKLTYLKKEKNNGRKFFISSGYKRYLALLSLSIGSTVTDDDEVSDAIRFIIDNNLLNKNREYLINNEHQKINNYLYIPALLLDKKIKYEEDIYLSC